MARKTRRKKFLVHKPFQFRYLVYVTLTLLIVCGTSMLGSYYSIWASVLKAFSQSSVQNEVITAAQISEYEAARQPLPSKTLIPTIRFFRETELLSAREREIIRQIMDEANQKMFVLSLLLIVFIGWGSIYLTHKIAGPIFKVKQSLNEVKNGDLTIRIRFRKFDEIQDVASQFNETISVLDRSLGKVKRLLREMPKAELVDELQKELQRFRTTSS